jgi:polysaccharide biosynthesis/export protein
MFAVSGCAKLRTLVQRRGIFFMQHAQAGVFRALSRFFGILFWLVIFSVVCALAQENTKQQAPPKDSDASQAQHENATAPSAAQKNESNSDSGPMRLGVGDLLEVNVYGVPELSTKARVSNSGDVYLPLISYVHVADLSAEEAQALIEKRLSDGGFLKNPHVSLFIDEYSSQAITVLGEVAKPGPYPIMGERRLYDLISAAGGLTEKAGRTVTISHRTTPDQPVTVRLGEGLAQTSESNVPVKPGDTIVVQRAGIVYVVGDVGKPSGFLMDNDSLTVLKAIALAGGTNRTAKLNGAKIIRKTPEGMQETAIPLKNILQAKAADVPMRADDILFVPGSAGKAAAYRGVEAVLQAATALSIVAVPRP